MATVAAVVTMVTVVTELDESRLCRRVTEAGLQFDLRQTFHHHPHAGGLAPTAHSCDAHSVICAHRAISAHHVIRWTPQALTKMQRM